MDGTVQISTAASRLGVSPHYIRILEKRGRIPPARRDSNGRIYSEYDLALLRRIGVGSGQRLKTFEDFTGLGSETSSGWQDGRR